MEAEPRHESFNGNTDALPSVPAMLQETPVVLNGTQPVADSDAAAAAASANSAAFSSNSATISEPSDSLINQKSIVATDAAPAPIEQVSAGIQPISDFIPTEKTHNSHPTPPPEPTSHERTDSTAAAAPREIINTTLGSSSEALNVPEAQTVEVGASTSLPPVDSITAAVPSAGEALLNGVSHLAESSATSVPPLDTSSTSSAMEANSMTSSLVRPREEDLEEDGPAAKRSKVEETTESTPIDAAPVSDAATQDISMPDAPVQSVEPATPVSAIAENATYFTAPITDLQKAFLVEKTKNLKKTKHAIWFQAPVDIVKLNIPNYPNIVKQPMDLSTLESKLKTDQYSSPQEYANDFTLIVTNSRLFNGDAHPVTQAAVNMEATFKKYMSALPGPQEVAAPKIIKRASPAAPRPQPRREARLPPPPPPPAAPAAPAAASPAAAHQTFALQPDGMPQIRRDSTTKRPHRTIKPPANRELAYAKPKRKEHQLELKFCEHILDQLRSPKYHPSNSVFLSPVDPVALNIPHYRQVIKKPMDLSSMAQKLRGGYYGTAKEFRADFELMIDNCLLFNPNGNPVRDLGIEMRRSFELLWKEKEKWERANKKSSERASSASESEDEEEDDEDDDDPAANARETIAALTKQLAELQKTVAAASWSKDSKKKSKDSKKGSKKNSLSAPASKKSVKSKAPKKFKPLSYEEKQEISTAVGKMDEAQVQKLTQIIMDNCEKYRNMGDDMELEIDELPNEVQGMLLRHVRSIFGNPKRDRAASPDDLAADDDDDFAPPARDRAAAGGKRKKHKPMGKKEQQESITELRNRLAEFNNQASGSESPYGRTQQDPDTSGDEESEESEEE